LTAIDERKVWNTRAALPKPARILCAMFQGGGNVPLLMPIVVRLVERGHTVRVMAGPGVRRSRLPVSAEFLHQIATSGAALVAFREPHSNPLAGAGDFRGIVGRWVPPGFRSIPGEAQTAAWASAWAANVAEELRAEPADLVVADFVLLGALVAAERFNTRAVALMHTVAPQPLAGIPPYGPGWMPGAGPFHRIRDALGRAVIEHLHRRNALAPLNQARISLGLPPLRSPFQQYESAARVLMLVSAAFDHAPHRLPVNLRHVGTPLDDARVPEWRPADADDDSRPLVLVSLSTLNQGQAPLLRRILAAMTEIEARVLVTLGPALEPGSFQPPPNVRLKRFIPHSAVLRHVALMVTQCGLGSVTKALAHGVPLLCIPLVGDQPENAARVVARGAGLRLRGDAQPREISASLRRLLTERRFSEAASALAAIIAREPDATTRATEEIETVLNGNADQPSHT
jgi:MGT family glycosyltransferase